MEIIRMIVNYIDWEAVMYVIAALVVYFYGFACGEHHKDKEVNKFAVRCNKLEKDMDLIKAIGADEYLEIQETGTVDLS